MRNESASALRAGSTHCAGAALGSRCAAPVSVRSRNFVRAQIFEQQRDERSDVRVVQVRKLLRRPQRPRATSMPYRGSRSMQTSQHAVGH